MARCEQDKENEPGGKSATGGPAKRQKAKKPSNNASLLLFDEYHSTFLPIVSTTSVYSRSPKPNWKL